MAAPEEEPKGRCGAPALDACEALWVAGSCQPRKAPPAIVELMLRTSSSEARGVAAMLAGDPAQVSIVSLKEKGRNACHAPQSCFSLSI